ncbi:MAG: NAD(P)-dependent oxidoreductase [Lentisphaerae bacterium]|nr:NAD(P)-dependent oxidoreductase [Lentisphaerota bacterium]MBT4819492.1 NAD(P)-dependent oxidoreductase [Lentisphaerota bacterium]MBT5605360.1 NAD(P)-dependent oxidoreductase [Lentisphaerota bacterium]MBT7060365.1 NAD(P)-dependent oxidoreductase [Lentisphaerota bacterium]MBT7844781.1 NAD(P)-dependent oxidoreductase [Lentisphaerota bacterium]
MSDLPEKIASVDMLDDLLSRPSPALVEAMRQLEGDIMVVGAGGKIGPTMARMAKRAVTEAGVEKDIIAVDVVPLPELEAAGITTLTCDFLDIDAVDKLPEVKNIVYMIGRKFGSTGSESLTWAINCIVPYHAARKFQGSRVLSFSTGCVYPVMHLSTGGATETTGMDPVGEYAMSCLGRERMFDVYADRGTEDVLHVRLNYAVECRYGVLYDIAHKVWTGEAVDITTGYANVIWQGDACEQALRSFPFATHPATILNVTGPETFAIRQVAQRFGELMDKEATFIGEENGMGYLSNASRANALFGNPSVPLDRILQWTAAWIMEDGENLGKPTHFETQDGKY